MTEKSTSLPLPSLLPEERSSAQTKDSGIPRKQKTNRGGNRVLSLCFFLSGVAGLIYQIAWTKALGLVFGHTVYAIAIVLATFMGGLAAGSAWLGRWGGRHRRPIALYGWLELCIAATGALSLIGIDAVRSLYIVTFHAVSGWLPLLIVVRALASALVLFVPTFLMGGTLPILIRGFSQLSDELGPRVSRLYWINTLGAVAGASAGGFLLLPAIGLRWTVLIAVALNVVAAGLALWMQAGESAIPETEQPESRSAIPTPTLLLVIFAAVGATAMAYEIGWTRLLATNIGSSTYAYTTMLATFLTGMVIGSYLFELWISRGNKVSIATFAATQTLTGLGGIIFLASYQWLPAVPLALLRSGLPRSGHIPFGAFIAIQFATCALAMLPTAIVFGFNFPMVVVLLAGEGERGASESAAVGRACAANTVGAIVGALAAGFWLLPLLGSFRLLALTVAFNLALAVALQVRRSPRRDLELAGNALLALLVVAAGISGLLYDRQIANFSIANHAEQYPKSLSLDELAHRNDLLFAEDGLNASIDVARGQGFISLRTNGKIDASTGDARTQLILGHLGGIFHPGLKKVLVIGFGSGMTLSAVARYPGVQQIDCVEIEPAVLHAAPYLATLNRGVLQDQRVHLIIDDARSFLFTTDAHYDLIISEPSNPWIAGIATLFTREFYREARTHLTSGGMFVQWVQAYSIFPEDLKMILGTLAGEFAQVSLWTGSGGDYVLLGQSSAQSLSLDNLRALWPLPALREDYQQLGLQTPEGVIAYYQLGDADLRRLVAGSHQNTDDKTSLEYRAPMALFATGTVRENNLMILAARSCVLPPSIPINDTRAALIAATETSLRVPGANAGFYLAALATDPSSPETELLRGRWLASTQHLAEAREALETARRLDPDSTATLLELANVALQQKDYGASEQLLSQMLRKQPELVPAMRSYTLLEIGRENFAEALRWQKTVLSLDQAPSIEDVDLLARLLTQVGDDRRAEGVYASSVQRDNYDFHARLGLGQIYLRQKRWEEARKQLEIVIRYSPEASPEVYLNLAHVYLGTGRLGDAKSILKKGERIFPKEPIFSKAAEGLSGI